MTLTPRKVPRQARSRATCEVVLEAAARIVAERGLAGFNTNAVAERAGVSIGSLYQYYPNKDALMAAVIERQQGRQLERLKAAAESIAAGQPLEAAIRTLVKAAMQHHRDNDLLASAIDHEEVRLPLDRVLGGFLEQSSAIIAALMAQRADLAITVDPQIAARTIPPLVRAVVDAWANLQPPQLDRAEDEAVRAVLGYLLQGTDQAAPAKI